MAAKGVKTIEGHGHIPYKPMHPDNPTDVAKPDGNRTGYTGVPDGIQSEASTREADEMLSIDNIETDAKGMRIRNPGGKAWYTKDFNAG